jgi:hypothetical protein
MHTLKRPTNTFFSWPKAAVTISTLPEQTHNNLCWNEICRNKKPERSHNIIINNSKFAEYKNAFYFTN